MAHSPLMEHIKYLATCGTHAAYVRHLRHKETPCEQCRLAHNQYMRTMRQHRRNSK